VTSVQNAEKFLNSPTVIVVQKGKRKKAKFQQLRFTFLHLIESNAGFILCNIIFSQFSKEKDVHNEKTP